MRLSYRKIVSSEDAAFEDVLISFRKDIMLLISSNANNVTKRTWKPFDKCLIKSYLLYDMEIMLYDEVGSEETANPAAKHLNDSHSCVMKYILFGHIRSLLFLLKKACPFFVKLRSSPM